MTTARIVSRDEWIEARKALLTKEKELTQSRAKLTKLRSELPWTQVTKTYVFDSADGPVALPDLFGPRSQLIVYHFMFDPDWSEGCKSCSFVADHYNPITVHLNQRDVSMVTVSRAPLNKLLSFKKRMGWTFDWVSSFGTDFNRDFHVSFSEQDLSTNAVYYNYETQPFPVREAPGISVFKKSADGQVFHTYSSYGRGLENMLGTYTFLDLVPKGRDEATLSYGMQWVRHHDRYDTAAPDASISGGRR